LLLMALVVSTEPALGRIHMGKPFDLHLFPLASEHFTCGHVQPIRKSIRS
jgi:hypothetical protein